MAPQGCPGVDVLAWDDRPIAAEHLAAGGAPDVLIEAFGCDPAPAVVAQFAQAMEKDGRKRCWINLEYLSAEPYVERLHGLPSPVFRGPGAGLTKHFFYPGFTPATGGLLREDDLAARQAAFDRKRWLASQGVRELFLVSENNTSYGKDLGDIRLLETMLPEIAAIDGVERVRVSYLQPAETRPGLIEAIATTPGVTPYFDLSFQHASAGVLRRMRRFGDP